MTTILVGLGLSLLTLRIRRRGLRIVIQLVLMASAPGSLVPWLLVALIVFDLLRRPRLRHTRAAPSAMRRALTTAAPITAKHNGGIELDEDGRGAIDPASLVSMATPPQTIVAIPSPESLIDAMRAIAHLTDIPDPARDRPPLVVSATERLIERVLVERGFDPDTPRFTAAASACRCALLYAADERRANRN